MLRRSKEADDKKTQFSSHPHTINCSRFVPPKSVNIL